MVKQKPAFEIVPRLFVLDTLKYLFIPNLHPTSLGLF